jgi:hypothetical protein
MTSAAEYKFTVMSPERRLLRRLSVLVVAAPTKTWRALTASGRMTSSGLEAHAPTALPLSSTSFARLYRA